MRSDLVGSGPVMRGDGTTLDSICAAQFRPLAGALRLYLGQPLVADELAQEALLRFCIVWERGERIESPAAWLHHAGFNLARSWLRRRWPSAALRALPLRQRQALVLRYYADLDVAATAR